MESVEMSNIGTKLSSQDDGLLTRLYISTHMRHEPDLSAARSGTSVCLRTREITYSRGIIDNVHTIHTTRTLVASSARNVSVVNQLHFLTQQSPVLDW